MAESGPKERGEAAREELERAEEGVDAVSILYIFGGIPAMVAFFVLLFTLVHFFPSIPP